MAFIGQALGSGGQSDWQATDNSGNLLNPNITPGQTGQAYDQAQQGIQQQQAFMQALQAQNGIANQNAAFQGYQGLANGTGPNPAQAQLAQATQANVANQAALAAGQRGASQNVGMIARGAAQQGANAQQQAAGQAATMGAQQQIQGLQGMAGIAGQQVGNQAQATQGYNQAAQSEQANLFGAQGAYNNAQAGIYNNMNTANQGVAIQNNKAQQGIFGGLLGGSGAVLSDKNQKTDVKPADDKIKDFLDKAGAHEYSYKDSSMPGASPGKHVSPMAQELEKSEIGKQMVIDTPNGKGVDYGKSMGTLVAALASLNKRLDSMEGGKSPKKMAEGGEVPDAPDYESFPGPQKLAGGGFLYGGTMAPNPNQQQQQPGVTNIYSDNNPVQSGGSQLGQAITKPLQPYIDQFKTGISDYFNNEKSVDLDKMSDTQLSGAENPRGMESLDGSQVAPQDLGDAPLSGADASGGAAEGGTEVAAADTGAASAGEAAAGAEAAEGADTALLALASKGAAPKKKVPALVSPGEAYIPPHKVAAVTSGKQTVRQAGEIIPGKAKVKGDSTKNDTVSKTLDAGGVVVPRTKMKSNDHAAKFVQHIMFNSHRKAK